MPQNPSSTAIPREDLQTVMDFDLEMQRRNYVGSRLMPLFGVQARSGRFPRIKLASLLAASGEKIERAAKAGFSRADWEFEIDSFVTVPRGVEEEIDDDERELYKDFFDCEMVATMRAYERLFNAYEQRVIAETVTATVTATHTAAATAAWDVAASADPRADVKAGKLYIWEKTGLMPNTLVISEWTMENLRDADAIIERINSAGAGSSTKPNEITEQQLAQVLGVDQVLVAKSVSYDGTTVSSVFPSDKALLIRTPTTNDMREPCFGRTFVWTGAWGDFMAMPFSYRQENIAADIIRLAHESEEKTIYPELAYVITGVETEGS